MDYNTQFNTSGKFPTDPEFWVGSKDQYVTEEGITKGFSKILGEQVFRPLGQAITPFYNTFAGRPLRQGQAWKENALYRTTSRHFKPKATAQDDLGFVDAEGIEKVFKLDVAGWIKQSIPSDLETIEMMFNNGEIGMLNSMLVDNVMLNYQRDIEASIGLKLVSNIQAEEDIDFTDGQQAVKDINKLALKMRGERNHYNQLTEAQNAKLYTASRDVICFIDAETLEMMRESFATLPSPDRISENVTFVPMIDGCPKPVTTTEFNAGTGEDAGGTTINWEGQPVAIDEDKPVAMLVSRDICEYRPLIGSYKINMSKNGAGDFENEHLLWKGGIAIRPWENAIRLNQSA